MPYFLKLREFLKNHNWDKEQKIKRHTNAQSLRQSLLIKRLKILSANDEQEIYDNFMELVKVIDNIDIDGSL